MKKLVVAAMLLVLSACGGSDATQQDSPPPPEPTGDSELSEAPDPQADPRDDDGDGETCAEVRAGIDAFNRGDFNETISRFESAVPLAEAAAQDEPSRLADDLLEAVIYYAELPAQEYEQAAVESPDFLKYKQITLSQCASEGQTGIPEEPDVVV